MKNIGYLLLLSIALTSCGPVSVSRSFLDEMEKEDQRHFVEGQQFDRVGGDFNKNPYTKKDLYERTPENSSIFPNMSETNSLGTELERKVATLDEAQKEWFRKNESLFKSDSQKIYFLGLSDEERYSYLNELSNVRTPRGNDQYRKMASVMEYSPRQARDVFVGMDKDKVIELWGNPHQVAVAGNPSLENERWTFIEMGSAKYIYFTRGKVEGWSLE